MTSLFLRSSMRQLLAPRPLVGSVTKRNFSISKVYDTQIDPQTALARAAVARMVESYRSKGHLRARLDPLGRQHNDPVPELEPSYHGLDAVSTKVPVSGLLSLPNGETSATVSEIQRHLGSVYCGNVGWQFSHLESEEERLWLSRQAETQTTQSLSPAEKRNIHTLMVMSEVFDHFLGRKFASFKRYALEGNESMMPAVDAIFNRAAQHGVLDVVLGMPHRGRLNLLVGLLEYPARQLFYKIKGNSDIPATLPGLDDVVSHIACSVDKKYPGASSPVHVSLMHNPSHLEAINPVSMGKTRAKQDDRKDATRSQVMNLCLHGDAAVAGQGVVPETFMMGRLPGFSVGGTVHLVVNNQIGFTTTPDDGRSARYCSDLFLNIGGGVPVIHVNSDHPEQVVKACRLAVDYQARFKKDVIVDLIGYRRHGHNEVDEPAFTQPLMYEKIRGAQPTSPSTYTALLKQEGLITEETNARLVQKFNEHLESELTAVDSVVPSEAQVHSPSFKGNRSMTGKWEGMKLGAACAEPASTGFDVDTLRRVGEASVKVPEGFEIHSRLQRTHQQARLKALSNNSVDWATAEAMAFGSLLLEGYNIRMAGQDVERGTFSQRHVGLWEQKKEQQFFPLQHLSPSQGRFIAANSHLSEFAVMGYEYGFSLESPKNLSIWEAQFGDFNNGAQIIIDTFLSGGETKWLRQSAMVLLLPHGYDGAGPEHSSSRVERFLQLVDTQALSRTSSSPLIPSTLEDASYSHSAINMNVVNCTTPANYFHVLRRQMMRNYRKPLVVVSPKTLLRHPQCVSAVEEMGPGSKFMPVLGENKVDAAGVRKLVFCSGKIYYDLVKERETAGHNDTAIIRIEEIAPFPRAEVLAEVARYPNATKAVWLQEEPLNAGCYAFVEPHFARLGGAFARMNSEDRLAAGTVKYVGRAAIPAPATGISKQHSQQQAELIKAAFSA